MLRTDTDLLFAVRDVPVPGAAGWPWHGTTRPATWSAGNITRLYARNSHHILTCSVSLPSVTVAHGALLCVTTTCWALSSSARQTGHIQYIAAVAAGSAANHHHHHSPTSPSCIKTTIPLRPSATVNGSGGGRRPTASASASAAVVAASSANGTALLYAASSLTDPVLGAAICTSSPSVRSCAIIPEAEDEDEDENGDEEDEPSDGSLACKFCAHARQNRSLQLCFVRSQ